MSYKELPNDTRVWVYQSNRPFTEEEIRSIKEQGDDFLRKWSAHGTKLKAAFEIFYDRFIALFVDENQARASGCSIDKSVHFIKQLEIEFDISLLDRNYVSYKDGGKVITCSNSDFIARYKNGDVIESTIVFNNLVTNKAEFDNDWQQPLKQSWHIKLL